MAVKHKHNSKFCIFSILFFIFIGIGTCYVLWKDTPYYDAQVMHDDVQRLSGILKKIDDACDILSIRKTGAQIDFLNVSSFAGSEVGPLNLAHPKKWQGPYMDDIITYKGVPYEIATVNNNYYIIPGNGATLPTKVTLGKDLIIDSSTNIDDLIAPGGALNYKDHALGTRLDFVIGDWDAKGTKKEDLDTLKQEIQEFNEDLSFT